MHVYKAYPGGKFKVLTLSYDDGKFSDRRLVEMFNQYGLKATFNLNGGIRDEVRIPVEEWKELYAGHEIASHSLTHPTISRCSTSEIITELVEDRLALEKIFDTPILGHAFPNGSVSAEIRQLLKDLGFLYGRTITDSYCLVRATEYAKQVDNNQLPVVGEITGFEFPEDFYAWNPTCHHNHDLLGYGKKFLELTKKQYTYLFYVWGHSYEFDRDNNWDMMEEFCKMVSHRDDIWYATNLEIVQYEEAFRRLIFTMDHHQVVNPNACSVWLSVDDGNRIVEVPGGATVNIFQPISN